jgi:hypothetical protein
MLKIEVLQVYQQLVVVAATFSFSTFTDVQRVWLLLLLLLKFIEFCH